MIETPQCPSCHALEWRAVERHRYEASELANARLTDYQRLRLRVLFEVWMPDRARVELRTIMCSRCGFVCYAPRPDAGDLEAKYRFLLAEEGAAAGAGSAQAIARDHPRAERTFRAVGRHARTTPGRVLDHGGAEGRVLAPFIEAGWSCALVDYVEEVLPGVERLGVTLDDVPDGAHFDAIVCSHVLEHLADPGETLRRLAGLLVPGGVLFAEVPVDLWRGPPIRHDPATHVNFLTPLTLEQLLVRNGFVMMELQEISGSYAGVVKDLAVAVARPGSYAQPSAAAAIREAERRLNPTPGMELRRLWRQRVLPVAARLTPGRSGG